MEIPCSERLRFCKTKSWPVSNSERLRKLYKVLRNLLCVVFTYSFATACKYNIIINYPAFYCCQHTRMLLLNVYNHVKQTKPCLLSLYQYQELALRCQDKIVAKLDSLYKRTANNKLICVLFLRKQQYTASKIALQ